MSILNIIAIISSIISTAVGSVLVFSAWYLWYNYDTLKTHLTLEEEQFNLTIVPVLVVIGGSLIYTGIIQWPFL